MDLQLGTHRFDVSTHALVMAQIDGEAEISVAQALQAQGASAVLLTGKYDQLAAACKRHATALDIPVAVAVTDAEIAATCMAAGAAMIAGGSLSDPALLLAVVESRASILIDVGGDRATPTTIERARWAQAAGLTPSQIIVTASTTNVHELAPLGYPVAVVSDDTRDQQGASVLAAMAGARLVINNQVKATKRTLSTVGELLQRRGVAAPDGVQLVGSS